MKMYQSSIEKEAIAQMPVCRRQGNIKLIDRPEQVAEAVKALKKAKVIGFDTESKPAFRRGVVNKIALLQLATADSAYLFRLNLLGANDDIKELLESDKVLKIGLSLHDDFDSLNQWMPCKPQNFIELQRFVKAFGIEDNSLQKIYAIIFGEKISKSQRLSNWEASALTEAQQVYAAIDAWTCLDIYHKLHEY